MSSLLNWFTKTDTDTPAGETGASKTPAFLTGGTSRTGTLFDKTKNCKRITATTNNKLKESYPERYYNDIVACQSVKKLYRPDTCDEQSYETASEEQRRNYYDDQQKCINKKQSNQEPETPQTPNAFTSTELFDQTKKCKSMGVVDKLTRDVLEASTPGRYYNDKAACQSVLKLYDPVTCEERDYETATAEQREKYYVNRQKCINYNKKKSMLKPLIDTSLSTLHEEKQKLQDDIQQANFILTTADSNTQDYAFAEADEASLSTKLAGVEEEITEETKKRDKKLAKMIAKAPPPNTLKKYLQSNGTLTDTSNTNTIGMFDKDDNCNIKHVSDDAVNSSRYTTTRKTCNDEVFQSKVAAQEELKMAAFDNAQNCTKTNVKTTEFEVNPNRYHMTKTSCRKSLPSAPLPDDAIVDVYDTRFQCEKRTVATKNIDEQQFEREIDCKKKLLRNIFHFVSDKAANEFISIAMSEIENLINDTGETTETTEQKNILLEIKEKKKNRLIEKLQDAVGLRNGPQLASLLGKLPASATYEDVMMSLDETVRYSTDDKCETATHLNGDYTSKLECRKKLLTQLLQKLLEKDHGYTGLMDENNRLLDIGFEQNAVLANESSTEAEKTKATEILDRNDIQVVENETRITQTRAKIDDTVNNAIENMPDDIDVEKIVAEITSDTTVFELVTALHVEQYFTPFPVQPVQVKRLPEIYDTSPLLSVYNTKNKCKPQNVTTQTKDMYFSESDCFLVLDFAEKVLDLVSKTNGLKTIRKEYDTLSVDITAKKRLELSYKRKHNSKSADEVHASIIENETKMTKLLHVIALKRLEVEEVVQTIVETAPEPAKLEVAFDKLKEMVVSAADPEEALILLKGGPLLKNDIAPKTSVTDLMNTLSNVKDKLNTLTPPVVAPVVSHVVAPVVAPVVTPVEKLVPHRHRPYMPPPPSAHVVEFAGLKKR